MAKRSKSGLKRKRQTVKRALQNQQVRSELKTLAKAAVQGQDQLLRAIAALDVAARKRIIHPNAAARKKSRLVHRIAREAAAPRA